jgi:sugar lactone lactonase YvrE
VSAPAARVLVDGTVSEPRLDHPEGVAIAADGSIWCGGERGQIYRIDPDTRAIEEVASTGGFCLGVAFDAHGDLFVCDLKHAVVFRLATGSGRLERFADGADGRRLRTPNALAFDAAGRLYVSDSLAQGEPGPGLYRFAPDGTGELWHDEPLHFANGLALAADGSALYVAETFTHAIVRIAIAPDGRAGARETMAELPGVLPDGLAFDADGRLYVACYEPSQILRIEPGGAVTPVLHDEQAHLLCHPTNVAFRGTQLIAANLGRWHLTAIEVGVTGAALPPSGGSA